MSLSLPFDFNTPSISSWLSQLNTSDSALAGHDIFKVLKILKNKADDIDIDSLELVVNRLNPVVVYTSTYLEKIFFDKGRSLSVQQRKVAQLSILLLRYLAILHVNLAARSFDRDNKTLHGNYAAQLIGLAFYNYALSYEKNSSSLWGSLGEIYALAVKGEYLDGDVSKPLSVFGKLPTIEAVLKRNLLFSVANCYDFSHKEIKTYFTFCSLNYGLVEFDRLSVKSNEGYVWEYESGQQPVPFAGKIDVKPLSQFELAASGTKIIPKLFFNMEPLFTAIKFSDVECPLAGELHLLEHLSSYKDIDAQGFSLPKKYIFVFGLEQCVEFFSKLENVSANVTFKRPSIDDLNFSSMNLKPLQVIKQKKKVTTTEIWGEIKPDSSKIERIELEFGAQKANLTKLPGFLAVEWMMVDVSFNGLIVMYGADMIPSVAVVRRLESNDRASVTQKGIIEVLGGSVSLVEIVGIDGPQKGLLLKQDEAYELILGIHRNVVGSVLKLKQGDVLLNGVLESTRTFIRYAVTFNDK